MLLNLQQDQEISFDFLTNLISLATVNALKTRILLPCLLIDLLLMSYAYMDNSRDIDRFCHRTLTNFDIKCTTSEL